MKDLGISITTYERGGRIMECVESVVENLGDLDPIIMVTDDHSQDDVPDIKEVERYFKDNEVRGYISRMEMNAGVGFLRNMHAYEMVTLENPKYLLFLDDDILLSQGYFDALLNELEVNPEAGLVGGVSDFVRGKNGWEGNPEYAEGRSFPVFNPYDNFMVRTEDLRRIGNLDRRLAYWEDMDLLIRMRVLGKRCFMVNEAHCEQEWKSPGGLQVQGREGREAEKLRCAAFVLEKYRDMVGLYHDGSLRLEIPFDDFEGMDPEKFRRPPFDLMP